jgi:hypothetical protein
MQVANVLILVKTSQILECRIWIEDFRVEPTPRTTAYSSRRTEIYLEGRVRVVSRRLAKSYLELVPTSEFGATTDVRSIPGYEQWLATKLLSSARTCRSQDFRKGLRCSITCRSYPAICTHTFGQNATFPGFRGTS